MWQYISNVIVWVSRAVHSLPVELKLKYLRPIIGYAELITIHVIAQVQ